MYCIATYRCNCTTCSSLTSSISYNNNTRITTSSAVATITRISNTSFSSPVSTTTSIGYTSTSYSICNTWSATRTTKTISISITWSSCSSSATPTSTTTIISLRRCYSRYITTSCLCTS